MSCLGNGAVFQMHFSSARYSRGNSCFHLCTCAGRDVQLNRQHALFIVVCIMLAYVLSLQICRIWHIFFWSSLNKIWLEKSVYICIFKTNKQNQKPTLNLVAVIWRYDLFGHLSKLLSVVKDRYTIFLYVYFILQVKYCLLSRSPEKEPGLLACTASSDSAPRIYLQLVDIISGEVSIHWVHAPQSTKCIFSANISVWALGYSHYKLKIADLLIKNPWKQ